VLAVEPAAIVTAVVGAAVDDIEDQQIRSSLIDDRRLQNHLLRPKVDRLPLT
jgi:hypothetical protein